VVDQWRGAFKALPGAARSRAGPRKWRQPCAVRRKALCETSTLDRKMPVRLKKLIGTVLLILLVIVYALVATMVAVAQLAESGPLTHFAFFLVTGLLWILPAMVIIKWMVLPPRVGR